MTKKSISVSMMFLIWLLSGMALPYTSYAGSFTVFGPENFGRTTMKPEEVVRYFTVSDLDAPYSIHIYNGGKNNQFEENVTSAAIQLNDSNIIMPNKFNQKVSHIEQPIKLSADNALSVELRSRPGSGMTIEIIGLDDTPPTIVASVSPAPNAAGWSNEEVIVSFVCSDSTSGIAFCSEPVVVDQEGANQVITGTAIDVAGNSAVASVSVNLDKTPPVVAIVSPSPGATIEDSSVTVHGTINEALSGVATITCNGAPATLSNSLFTCNVSLVMGENILQATATDLAGNTSQASIEVAYLGPKYLAIVDVMVTDRDNFNVPNDYTGLAWGGTATNPFIPGIIGERVVGNDVNVGIGGTYTTVWVKYDFVPVGSEQPVLVNYGAFHWPYWTPDCPEGWRPANGTSAGIQGALTTGTEGDCYNNGLCVQYLPMNQTETFITNVSLSYTYNSSEAACPALGEANLGFWPMQADTYDIHKNCEDDRWVYLCYGRGKAWPPMPTSIDVSDEEKFNFLATYAPRVWIAQDESYWPSSVEWAFPHLERFVPCTEYPLLCYGPYGPYGLNPEYESYYWLRTKEGVGGSDVLPFFRGCDGSSTSNPCTIYDAPVYAYWVKKEIQVGEDLVDVIDLVYFFYYPYNRGKEVLNTIWGNHVGDWEHVTVRLMWGYDDQTKWSLQPVQMYLSAHSFGGIYEWEAIPKIDDTHPIVYSAYGSHGIWLEAGRHTYGSAAGEDLTDWTNEGTAWDTWNYLETFDYNAKQGLGESIWPLWMSEDFANPGDCGDPSNPACGPIYRWGNMQSGCDFGFGNCRMENGPTGPVSKKVWNTGILK